MKKFMNRSLVFSCMFVVMLLCAMTTFAAEDYVLYVGGVQVTDENASDILGDLDGEDATAYYDAETSTLTLDNAFIETYYDYSNPEHNKPETAVIYSEQELNILVKGRCFIMTDATSSYNDFGICCKFPKASEGEERDALKISGFDDEAILVVSSAHALNETSALYTYNGDIVIENIDLNCHSASAVQSNTIYASGGSISIDNSDVSCDAGDAQTQSCGLLAGFGISISRASNVTFEAKRCEHNGESEVVSYGAFTLEKIIISEGSTLSVQAAEIKTVGAATSLGVVSSVVGTIEVCGNSKLEARSGYVFSSDSSATCVSIGVYTPGNILVTGESEIDGCGLYGATTSAGVFGQTITVEDGEISGSSAYNAQMYSGIASNNPIQGDNALVCDGDTKYCLEFVHGSDGLLGYYVNETGAISSNIIAASPMEFDLWVAGVRVTSENCDDVLGDGCVSYDHVTRTLTLDDATITDSYVYQTDEYKVDDGNGGEIDVVRTYSAGIQVEYPITLNIIGDVVIDCSDDTATSNVGINLDCMYSRNANSQKIIGDSNSSLTIKSGGKEESYGICIDSANFLIKDVHADVKAGDTTSNSLAFYAKDADYTIEFNNTTATFAGGDVDGGNVEIGGAGGIGGGAHIIITNKSNITASSGNVYAGNEEGACGGFVAIGLVEITGESTLSAYGGDVYSEGTQAMSFGMYVFGAIDIGDNCTLNTYGGDAHLSGEATIENTQSIGCGVAILNITVGDNAVFNSYGAYSDGGSAGVYIVDYNTTPEYDETVVFKTDSGVLNAGSTNTNTTATNVGIYSDNPVENGTVRDAETGDVLIYNGGVYTDSEGNYANMVTVNGGIIYFGDYNLAVGGIQVTKKNKDDIFGDLDGEGATAYYDAETKTLTLNNANITTYYDMGGAYLGIICMNSLNINLVGDNRIKIDSYETTPNLVAGIGVAGNLNISGADGATLDAGVGYSIDESYGIITMSTDGEYDVNVVISGDITVSASSEGVKHDGYGQSAGVYAYGTVTVENRANLSGYGGIAIRSETSTSSSKQGISAGVVAYAGLICNTTGTVYGYAEKGDYFYGGIGSLGTTIIKDGVVIGEAGTDVPEDSFAAGIATAADVTNVRKLTGTGEDNLYDGTWQYVNSNFGGVYMYSAEAGTYTKLISYGIGNLKVVEDEEGNEVVSVTVTGTQNVLVAVASYEASGRMVDIKWQTVANDTGVEDVMKDLDLTNAVTVKAFMFDGLMTARPLCEPEILELASKE